MPTNKSVAKKKKTALPQPKPVDISPAVTELRSIKDLIIRQLHIEQGLYTTFLWFYFAVVINIVVQTYYLYLLVNKH